MLRPLRRLSGSSSGSSVISEHGHYCVKMFFFEMSWLPFGRPLVAPTPGPPPRYEHFHAWLYPSPTWEFVGSFMP